MEKKRLGVILGELRRRLTVIYGDRLAKMVLYGSHARGDARPDSDIDVMVVLNGEVRPFQETLGTEDDVAAVCLEYDVVISMFFVSESDFSDAGEPLLVNANREGIPV
jgi:predicted nucleotidyltransferase